MAGLKSAAILSFLALAAPFARGSDYMITDLGTLGGALSYATAINARSHIQRRGPRASALFR